MLTKSQSNIQMRFSGFQFPIPKRTQSSYIHISTVQLSLGSSSFWRACHACYDVHNIQLTNKQNTHNLFVPEHWWRCCCCTRGPNQVPWNPFRIPLGVPGILYNTRHTWTYPCHTNNDMQRTSVEKRSERRVKCVWFLSWHNLNHNIGPLRLFSNHPNHSQPVIHRVIEWTSWLETPGENRATQPVRRNLLGYQNARPDIPCRINVLMNKTPSTT